MNYTRNITLDMNLEHDSPAVRVKQGDKLSRFIRATLTMDDEPYVPEADVSAMFRCEKPDGHAVVTDSAQVDPDYDRYLVVINGDGSITIELTEQVTAVPGRCKCDLCLYRGDVILRDRKSVV